MARLGARSVLAPLTGRAARRKSGRGATPALIFTAVLLGRAAPEAAPPRGEFYPPLTPEQLVSPRLRFDRGAPRISVGIETGADALSVQLPSAARLVFDEGGLPKRRFSAPGAAYGFRVRASTPARRRWWVRVFEHPGDAQKSAEVDAERWRRRNIGEVRVEAVGAAVGVAGKVLDTRGLEVLVGGFSERVEAEALAARLFTEEALRTVVRPTLEARARGQIEVLDAEGRPLHVAEDAVFVGSLRGERLRLWRGCLPPNACKGEGRAEPGHLYITVGAEGALAAVVSAPAEAILRGVVPAEIFATAPQAALQAQAIVARGAILSMLGHRHYDDPFHVCSEQHCQVYGGASRAHPQTDQAIRTTAGQVAVRPRRSSGTPLSLVDSVYSSSCGGHGADNDVVWDQVASPSLRGRLDGPAEDPALAAFRKGISARNLGPWLEAYPPTYCARASLAKPDKFRWTRSLDAEALAQRAEKLGVGPLTTLEVLGRGRGGRVTGLRVVGEQGFVEVLRELPVRRLFGLRSGAFQLRMKRDADGRLAEVSFTGAGWGHGAGMCQMGAIGRAEAGQSAADILRHYYSGAVVETLYPVP